MVLLKLKEGEASGELNTRVVRGNGQIVEIPLLETLDNTKGRFRVILPERCNNQPSKQGIDDKDVLG